MQPSAYNREKDFADDFPDETDGNAINRELDDASKSINETREALALIQRDDGGLQNGIVDADAVSAEFRADLYKDFSGDVEDRTQEAKAAAVEATNSAQNAASSLATVTDIADDFGDLSAARSLWDQAVEDSTSAAAVSSDFAELATFSAASADASAIAAAAGARARPSVAAALADASIAVGTSFTAPLADGNLQSYLKSSTTVASPIGTPFVSSASVKRLEGAPAVSLTQPNLFTFDEINFIDLSRMAQGTAANVTRILVNGLPALSLPVAAGATAPARYRIERSAVPGDMLSASILISLLTADTNLRAVPFSVTQLSAANATLSTHVVNVPSPIGSPVRVSVDPIAINPSTSYFYFALVNSASSDAPRSLHFSEILLASGASPLFRAPAGLAPSQSAEVEQKVDAAVAPLQEPVSSMLALFVKASMNLYPRYTIESTAPPSGARVAWNYQADGSVRENLLPKYGTSGFIPVSAGVIYTAAMHTAPDLWSYENTVSVKYYNAAGTFLINKPIDGTTVILRGNGRELQFTAPIGAVFAAFNMRTTQSANPTAAEFSQLLDALMVNEGSVALPFQAAPAVPGQLLPGPAFNTSGGGDVEPKDVTVAVSGDLYLVRTSWSDTHDKVQRINAAYNPGTIGTGATTNGAYDHDGERLIPSETAPKDTISAFGASTLITRTGNDESPPINLNTGYLGGGHGLPCRRITAAAHGKNNVDVGSVWSDGVRQWTLAGINDAATLSFVAAISGTPENWILSNAAVVGGSLTHVSGATNTGAITVTDNVAGQIWPFAQGYQISITADDRKIKQANGTYGAGKVVFSESYRIPNAYYAMQWVRAQVGNPSPVDYSNPAIAPQIEVDIVHSYDFTGICETLYTLPSIQGYAPKIYGGVQYQRPYSPAGYTCHAYFPRTIPFGAHNFAPGEDITANTENIYLTKGDPAKGEPPTWSDLADPPSRFITVAKQGGVAKHGIFSGFSHEVGVGVPAVRATRIASALLLSASEKHYPILGDTATPVIVGELLESLVWVGSFNPAADPDFVCKVIAPQLGKHVVYCYSLQALPNKWIKLPARFFGKPVVVKRNAGGAISVKSTIVSRNGVLVSFPSGGGELELLLG